MLTISKANNDSNSESIQNIKTKKRKTSPSKKNKTDKLKQYLSGTINSTLLDSSSINSINVNNTKDNINVSLSINLNNDKSKTFISNNVKSNNVKSNNVNTNTYTDTNTNTTIDKKINNSSNIVKFNDPRKQKIITSDNGKDQKIIEFYMECLEKHKLELNKEKLTVWMQVGSFFEVYGLIYPDGTKQGNVWDVANDLDIKVAKKKQSAYDNPDIEVYMAGAKEEYAEPYLETLIDKYGWTVAVYTQEKINGSNKINRVLKKILSPGINFESDNISNNYMYIYFKSNKSRLSNNTTLHIGIFFVDCISGENGIQELFAKDINDCNVILSEVVKLLTIKNPTEVVIHIDINDYENYNQLSKEECYSLFGLYDRNVNFIIETCPKEFYSTSHQKLMLENVYHSYKLRGNIFESLGLDDQNIYGRVVLCLGLNNIFQHDGSIISYLEKPSVLKGNSSYLMLANNCLQQLDIISTESNNKVSMLHNNSSIDNVIGNTFNNKRKSLLDILDKTKTVMGRRSFRNRLSMPIIDKTNLETNYQEIEDMQNIQKYYLSTTNNPDFILAPYNTIRTQLGTIRDISKILRKIVTKKCFPSDIVTMYESIESFLKLHKYIKEYMGYLPDSNTIKLLTETEIKDCELMNKYILDTFDFDKSISHWALFNNSFFIKGNNEKIDKLQDDLLKDRDFFFLFKKELTLIINPELKQRLECESQDSENITSLLEINEGSNAKLNRYVYCNEKNMKKILEYEKTNPNTSIKIGNYNIKLNTLQFTLLRKGVYHIKTPYIDIASRNYVTNLYELKKLCIDEFKSWSHNFYLKNNININNYIKWIANIDVIQSCSIIADKYGYTRPKLYYNESITDILEEESTKLSKSFIKVEGLRHPIIERYLKDNQYITNDVSLGYTDQDGILLFGLNAAGKSSLAKSIGIAIIMAQAGMFVACNNMLFNPYKYLFTRIRNNDDIYAGLSSFEVEMKEFKVILDYANSESLILGDELCSGTETLDATALMASGLNQLSSRKASYIFATHLHFLTEVECVNNLDNLKYYHLAVKQDIEKPGKLVYERKLKSGNGPQSYGILVCKSMKLDNEFVRMAEIVRAQIERGEVLKFDNRLTNTDITNKKPSKYNTEKLFQNCEVCGDKGEDIHHINMQCTANNKGIISTDMGKFHKNEKWNLVCLCKKCHQSVHSSCPSIKINGYIETSVGRELNYEILEIISCNTNTKQECNKVLNNTFNNKKDLSSNDFNNTGDNEDNKDLSANDFNINDNKINKVIKQLFNEGKTIRSIQYQIRENYNEKLKIKEIQDIITNI